jgi:hypothetical protein
LAIIQDILRQIDILFYSLQRSPWQAINVAFASATIYISRHAGKQYITTNIINPSIHIKQIIIYRQSDMGTELSLQKISPDESLGETGISFRAVRFPAAEQPLEQDLRMTDN